MYNFVGEHSCWRLNFLVVIRVSTSKWAVVTHCWIVKWLLLTISWLIKDPRAVTISGWPITTLRTLDLPYQILALQTKYGVYIQQIISNWFSSFLLTNSVTPNTSPPKKSCHTYPHLWRHFWRGFMGIYIRPWINRKEQIGASSSRRSNCRRVRFICPKKTICSSLY